MLLHLAEHPFVHRSKEERSKLHGGTEIIIARELGKKKHERQEDTDSGSLNDNSAATSADEKSIRAKSKAKRRKGLKEKVERPTHIPAQQFDPYRPGESSKPAHNGHKGKGQSGGKSMTFVS